MKSFLTAMTIALAVIIGGIMFNVCIGNLSDRLIDRCEEITQQLNNLDFSEASKGVSEMSEYIDKKKIVLASILNHESIDDIEVCVSELQGYTDNRYLVEALVRCRKLKHLFEHLPADYTVSPQNIL